MLRYFFAAISISFSTFLIGQEQNDHHIALQPKNDSVCLKECFQKAHWEAHTRTFFMSTINEGALKDDYALGSGAGIGVLTRSLYGFQFGISGFFMYNIFSSNIYENDTLTLQPNRYEVGLFDVENPGNKNDLDRLEELYIKYSRSKNSLTVGKINLNTPFLNPQDGRMRPTLEEGVWLSVKESKTIGFNGGWIWDVSPRSTVRWFSLAKSMGVYPSGVDINGRRSDYSGNIAGSSGMAIANIYINATKQFKINFWNSYMENVMNTAITEVNLEQARTNFKFYENIIYVHQDAVNNGGNIDPAKTYINKGAQSNVISTQVGLKNKRANISLNYTHITGDGRYLMPREWGREPFFTFLPRERNEGLGGVNAFMTKIVLISVDDKLKTSVGYGYYKLPDVKNYRLNKYGMPSYHQLNVDLGYSFSKFLDGMDLKILAAFKFQEGVTYNNLKYIYNKINMANLNLVLDFKI